jgi:parvulin-like peptidyl-prolyl isomerase
MKNSRLLLAALLALLPMAVASAGVRTAPSAGTVALVADRRVDDADIRRAALVMEQDPLRTREPRTWRRKLLDLCVDRELLALEAERRGFLDQAGVKGAIDRASADLLYAVLRERVLLPEVTPSASELDTARAGGLFRRVRLRYILSVTDRKATYELFEALKQGARFDSVALLYSVHPSAARGGDVGWKRVGELNRKSWTEFRNVKPGDVLGPYVNDESHEYYKVEAVEDPDDNALRETLLRDRMPSLETHYSIRLLRKYHFAVNSEEVSSIIFAAATERADSILASLDSRGRRGKKGVRPSLGILARADGDSITYRDLAATSAMVRDSTGKARIEDSHALLLACSTAMLPRLIARDARSHGLDRDPAVARGLRLLREEISTRAMVAHEVPALGSSAVRAYFDSHAVRYTRPSARRAFVTVFGSADTARMARAGWTRAAFRDSVAAVEGFQAVDHWTLGTLFPRHHGEISLFDTDDDSLSVAVRNMPEGQISPLIEVPNGYALAQALGREPARALTFEEARRDANVDAREDAENNWIVKELERLRAATPARAVPGRLDALRLQVSSDTGGNRR